MTIFCRSLPNLSERRGLCIRKCALMDGRTDGWIDEWMDGRWVGQKYAWVKRMEDLMSERTDAPTTIKI